jgi:hypothetical protein
MIFCTKLFGNYLLLNSLEGELYINNIRFSYFNFYMLTNVLLGWMHNTNAHIQEPKRWVGYRSWQV